MWDVYAHEMARLPMIYAAAWDVGGDIEHYNLYRQYLPEALQDTLALPDLPPQETAMRIPPYSVLQMQNSLEVLYGVEQEAAMKSDIRQAMFQVAEFTETKLQTTNRQTGELAISQLMAEDYVFTSQHRAQLADAIMATNYETDPEAAYVLQGAYWKAVRNGEIAEGRPPEGLLVEESFNYGQASWNWSGGSYSGHVTDTGLDGGKGFTDGSQWGVGLAGGTTTGTVSIVDGITFGDLQTSGGALFTENSADAALASRATDIDVPAGTTVWTSYLWRFTEEGNINATAASQFVDGGDQFGSSGKQLRIIPKVYGTRVKSRMSEGTYNLDADIPLLQDGDTYLMIAKNGNIGQTGSNTLWIIPESGFDICTADGIVTEQELDDNCVGTATGNLLSNTISSGAYLQLANWWGAGTFDEFRMGLTLEDVTPLGEDPAPGLAGDLDGDGFVGSADLDIIRAAWGETVTGGGPEGDPSGDGFVGSADLDIVRGNWGASSPVAVPEPNVLLLAMFGFAAFCAIRRR